MSGIKNDKGKPCFDRLSFQALGEMNKVHEAGDKKYEEGNWRKGLDVVRLANAAIRHISQFLDGEITDSETNTYHVANAAVSLEMIIHMLINAKEYEDFINLPKRPTPKISRNQEALWSGFVPKDWKELQAKDFELYGAIEKPGKCPFPECSHFVALKEQDEESLLRTVKQGEAIRWTIKKSNSKDTVDLGGS